MRILVTGGGGVLGRLVARALLERGSMAAAFGANSETIEVMLFDRELPVTSPPGATRMTGDVTNASSVEQVFQAGIDAVFHLAAVVSAAAEADFDLGMRVNLDGLRVVLDACRKQPRPPRVVFASSVAAFGGTLPAVIDDATATTPQSSYGTQKVIGELLIADMTRKGFIDGRTMRLPTIVVRPGKANRAASGFMSNILREPINGEAASCPVSANSAMWILSPERAVDALVHAMQLPAERYGGNPTVNAPGLTVTVAEALDGLGRIVGSEAVARVRFERDPAIERIVLSWPARFETPRAESLGFRGDESIDDIIRAHLRSLAR